MTPAYLLQIRQEVFLRRAQKVQNLVGGALLERLDPVCIDELKHALQCRHIMLLHHLEAP